MVLLIFFTYLRGEKVLIFLWAFSFVWKVYFFCLLIGTGTGLQAYGLDIASCRKCYQAKVSLFLGEL